MKTFEELGVRDDLRKAIEELGFENPMPVQEKVIPHLLNEDGDVVALAQTGTGKPQLSDCRCSSASTYRTMCPRR